MKKFLWTTFACLLLVSGQTHALEITSLAPTRGTPGTLVAIGGGPFSPQTQPFLGEQYVAPRITLKNHMEFTVPFLPPGSYALTVQDDTMIAAQVYQFEVMSPTPQITDIDPLILDACSIGSRNRLEVNGRNFLPGASLLINENIVPGEVVSSTLIVAQLPELQQPGGYGISVHNPDGATSLPHSLWVNSTPEIVSVERGTDFVNYYEVIIRGKNFLFNSTLVVKEPENSAPGRAYKQLSFVPRSSAASHQRLDTVAPQRNRLIYVDCQTLIYNRYPTSFQDKDLRLQIFNPDGRKTNLYDVALP